jgi:hypothetical protein
MPHSKDEIIDLLRTGNFDALIGEFESDWLECKRQPYAIDSDEQKLELAKDVASLANANGGLLLIGLSTTKSPTHGMDQIDRARPFPITMFDPTRYGQVLADWLWPPIDDLEIDLFPSSTDTTKGVAAIAVPSVSGPDRPVLITKTMLDTPRRVEILFGYCERKQAQVTHHDVERLQALLRDGRRLDSEIRENFQSLHAMLEDLRDQRAPERPASPLVNVEDRLNDALRAVGLSELPAFMLAAIPPRTLNLRSLFESRQAPLVQLLEHPPELRSSGFNIISDYNSRIHEGRVRRALADNYKLLELHRDGLAVFVARGDQDGLCWGRLERQREAFLINQLALIEMTYLFSRFVDTAFESHIEPGSEVRVDLRLLHLALNGNHSYLESGLLGRFGRSNLRQAPGESFEASTTYSYKENAPERVAVLLVAEVYAWFGFEEDRIPYTTSAPGGRIIDRDALASVG